MDIEEVSLIDLDQLKEVAKIAVLKSVEAPDEVKKKIVEDTFRHIETGMNQSDAVFLKEGGSNIRGFMLIQDYWNLSDLFVLPEHHGKSIGKELFLAALCQCREHSNKNYIRVNSSLNAQAFYRALGFTEFQPERKVPDYVVPLIYHF